MAVLQARRWAQLDANADKWLVKTPFVSVLLKFLYLDSKPDVRNIKQSHHFKSYGIKLSFFWDLGKKVSGLIMLWIME